MSTTWRGLILDGVAVTVRGGGDRALPVCRELLEAGARVTVVSDTRSDGLIDLIDRGLVGWSRRSQPTPPAALEVDLDGRHTPGTLGAVPVWRPDPQPSAPGRFDRTQPDRIQPDRIQPDQTQPGQTQPGQCGEVILVGGGPGDPGLITRAGHDALRSADVVVYDRLAPVSLLAALPADVELIDVSKVPRGPYTPQQAINDVLIDQAQRGRRVVRLKGGDSFVFGRGSEEVAAVTEAGLAVRVIPGVTSAVSVPELAGIPVTERGVSQGFAVVSGHLPPGHPSSSVRWGALAQADVTIVVLMGVANLAAIAAELRAAGLPGDTAVAIVCDGALASQRDARTTIAALTTDGLPDGVSAPAVAVIGAVARLGELG